jgi:hypothetical protein
MGKKKGRWRETVALLVLDATALGMFLGLMSWFGYDRVDVLYDPRNLVNFLLSAYLHPIVVTAILLLAATAWIRLKKRAHLSAWLMLLGYGAVLLVTVIPFAQDFSQTHAILSADRPLGGWETYLLAMTYPQGSLSFYVFILLPPLVWDYLGRQEKNRLRRAMQAAMVALCAVFTVTTLATAPAQIAAWQKNLAPARLVWDFKAGIDRYQANILVDYDTYQAFYDCEKIVVYNRLALWMVVPEDGFYPEAEDRFYPENKDFLAQLIRDRMEYAVVSRGSLENVRELAGMAGLSPIELETNVEYVILKLR